MNEVGALQAALAAEQATVYGYGIAGADMHGADRDAATAALEAHMVRRDRIMELITAAGATPVAAAAAYRLPFPVTGPASARQLAAHLEQASAGTLWNLIALSGRDSDTRSLAIGWLADAAALAARWGSPQALPGQPP